MQHLKKSLVLVAVFLYGQAFAQKDMADTVTTTARLSLQDSIAAVRINLNKTHMYILGAWAGVNIVQGSISASNLTGKDHYFHQMNVYWNTFNLALAGMGLWTAKKQLSRHFSFGDNIREQQKIEKILLLNIGLDAAYITTGMYLKERGLRLNRDQPQGYGNSLLLQGGFLLIFDIIQYTAHRKNGKLLEQALGNWQVGPTGAGLGVSYQFK